MPNSIDHCNLPAEAPPRLTLLWTDHGRRGLHASGAWDLADAERLSHALREHAKRARLLRLDVSDVTFLDCSCLQVLVDAHHRMLALEGTLVLTGVPARLTRLIEVAGLTDVLYTTRLRDLDNHADPLDPATGRLATLGR